MAGRLVVVVVYPSASIFVGGLDQLGRQLAGCTAAEWSSLPVDAERRRLENAAVVDAPVGELNAARRDDDLVITPGGAARLGPWTTR
jgi:hypothetical protein